jgi:hypothetical protein
LVTKPASAPAGAPTLSSSTIAYGKMDVFKLMSHFVRANPMIPEEARERLANVKSEGTEITFKLDVDNRLATEARVPLRVFKTIGELDN